MRYIHRACGSVLYAKLLGTYEAELGGSVIQAIAWQPQLIIDVGAAEGYYAVGFAVAVPNVLVYSFDSDDEARHQLRRLASLNGVLGRVVIGAHCDTAALATLNTGQDRILLFCDCEGAESELLNPRLVPWLLNAVMIVEVHDHKRSGISPALRARFQESHEIRSIAPSRRVYRGDPLFPLDKWEFEQATYERAPDAAGWLVLWPHPARKYAAQTE